MRLNSLEKKEGMGPLLEICSPFASEKKAMLWLYELTWAHDWVSIESKAVDIKNPDNFDVIDFEIHLKAKSNRRYTISGRVMQTDWEIAQIEPLQVRGTTAGGSEDIADAWCQLCISTSEYGELLPLGDQLISMALALRDDRALAKRLPLLELFLAHGREEYKWIQGYVSDGIILLDSDEVLYKLIPEELRYLDYQFSCIEDELQYAFLSQEDKQAIFDEEFRLIAKKVREKKQKHL